MQNLSKIGQETKKLQKMKNDIIMTSFFKNRSEILCVSIFSHTY